MIANFIEEDFMIRSMTGFGKGEGGGFVVEMRAVNHKFLDLSFKMPKDMLALENRLKRAVSERFSRGRIDIFITRGGSDETPKSLRLDTAAATNYMGLLTDLKNLLRLPGEISLELVASHKDVFAEVEEAEDMDAVWQSITSPLDAAMDALDAMRVAEGVALASDIKERADKLAGNMDSVEKLAPAVVSEYARKLRERIEKLASGVELSQDRIVQEVAIFADRADITEEIVRGRSHFGQLNTMLREGGPVGRKMDFLIQEINREVNTIGSKASDKDIAKVVVEMKSELEKVREQVQNIE